MLPPAYIAADASDPARADCPSRLHVDHDCCRPDRRREVATALWPGPSRAAMMTMFPASTVPLWHSSSRRKASARIACPCVRRQRTFAVRVVVDVGHCHAAAVELLLLTAGDSPPLPRLEQRHCHPSPTPKTRARQHPATPTPPRIQPLALTSPATVSFPATCHHHPGHALVLRALRCTESVRHQVNRTVCPPRRALTQKVLARARQLNQIPAQLS